MILVIQSSRYGFFTKNINITIERNVENKSTSTNKSTEEMGTTPTDEKLMIVECRSKLPDACLTKIGE